MVRRLDRIAVYGREGGTVIYELLGMAGDAWPDWAGLYESGLAAYEAREWEAALRCFEATIASRGGDRPAEIMIARCRMLLANPPGEDWRPLEMLHEK